MKEKESWGTSCAQVSYQLSVNLVLVNIPISLLFVACTCVLNHSCSTLRPYGLYPCLSMVFSRQEHWNGLLCPPPGDLPNDRDGTCISSVSCIGRWVLCHWCHLGSTEPAFKSFSSSLIFLTMGLLVRGRN